jgi:hypothetical protein
METQPQQEQPKKRGAQKGRVMSDAQREGLKKGLDALKAKREAKAKEKELKVKEPEPQPINQPEPINQSLPIINQVPAENPPLEKNPPLVKPKRDRQPKVNVSDLSKFKDDIIGNIREIQSKPAPVEKVIERVIEKPVYLTGSDLLNKIFNFN